MTAPACAKRVEGPPRPAMRKASDSAAGPPLLFFPSEPPRPARGFFFWAAAPSVSAGRLGPFYALKQGSAAAPPALRKTRVLRKRRRRVSWCRRRQLLRKSLVLRALAPNSDGECGRAPVGVIDVAGQRWPPPLRAGVGKGYATPLRALDPPRPARWAEGAAPEDAKKRHLATRAATHFSGPGSPSVLCVFGGSPRPQPLEERLKNKGLSKFGSWAARQLFLWYQVKDWYNSKRSARASAPSRAYTRASWGRFFARKTPRRGRRGVVL